MSVSNSIKTTQFSFDMKEVQNFLAQSVVNISTNMLQALIAGKKEKLNFAQLSDRHIDVKLEEMFNTLDNKTRKVFKKLFISTDEHIKNHSIPLQLALHMMNTQKKDPRAGGNFVASFVLFEAERAKAKLQESQPTSLDCEEIWV